MAKQPSLKIQRTSLLNIINGTGHALRRLGMDPFRINADTILEKSKKKVGFDKQLPDTELGLRKLVDSINNESRPNPFGALAVKRLLERLLYGRYMVEQVLEKNPHFEESAIKEPVFIIGMPRTGTTILHALLHEDPDHRSPLAWECLLPYPPPRADNYHDNPQLNTIRKEFDQLFKLVPDFLQKHYMAADSPQECLGITALDFNSFQFMAQLYLPGYLDWFAHEADKLSTLRFHKRFLQYLQSDGVKGKRWLLKSPVHMMRLEEIFEVYPDARIIMTHRHPAKVVTSTSSLISSVRTLYSDHEVPERTGKEQADYWSEMFSKFLNSRKKLDREDRFIDLYFDNFATDQIKTVSKIYDRFNWTLSTETVDRFKNFLEQNPRNKHGYHIYSLETFGLTEEKLNEQFGDYLLFLEYLKTLHDVA